MDSRGSFQLELLFDAVKRQFVLRTWCARLPTESRGVFLLAMPMECGTPPGGSFCLPSRRQASFGVPVSSTNLQITDFNLKL